MPVVLYNLACYYSLAGEKDNALSWLGRSRDVPGNEIVALRCNGTANHGIRRQVMETGAVLRLTA